MSRIGKQAITVPKEVTVTINDNNFVVVKGPKGELSFKFHENMTIKLDNQQISVTRPNDSLRNRALHGTTRALLNNMVIGVLKGYEKILDIKGVGYRALLKDSKTLVLNVGYSNPVEMEIIKNSHFLTRNIENNAKLKGSYFAESLQILNNKNSRILARLKNGSPVVVETLFGKGKTLFIGSFLGLANYSHADSINNKFLENLIQWSGITLPFTYSTTDANFPVEIRLHENSDGYLLFIINLNNERKQITVNLNMNKDGKFAVNEITSQKTEIIKSRNRQIKISTNVSGKNVKIFSIR